MATNMQERYNQLAASLLDDDPTGVKFGHNQIGLDKSGQFSAFDLKYKKGDPNALKQQGSSVVNALNTLVKEYGLDTSKIDGTKVGDYEALGSVRYDPGAGVVRSARDAFDEIYNKYLAGQVAPDDSAGKAVPVPTKAAAAPAAPLQYGQQQAPSVMSRQPPVGPGQMDVGNAIPPAPTPNVSPRPNRGPENAPGWQGPETRYNDLPTGPSLVSYAPQTSAYDDPLNNYLKPIYKTASTGSQMYDEMGLDLLARYGMDPNGEHLYFPNRGSFAAPGSPPEKYK